MSRIPADASPVLGQCPLGSPLLLFYVTTTDPSGGFKGGGGGGCPLLAYCIFFSRKSRFFRNTYITLCAFAINEDGADKLSSAPLPFKILDPQLTDPNHNSNSFFRQHVQLVAW